MKSVVVTGGTVRLGKAIADRLRADGWRVLATSHRRDAGADIVADLSGESGPDVLMAQAAARLGGLPDALVNNAALFTGEPDAITSVNFSAPAELTKLMAARGRGMGAVVNILDAGRRTAGSKAPEAYWRSKAELAAFTRAAAAAYAGALRVNGVAPGPVLAPEGVGEKAGRTVLARRPAPSDIAAAVSFLLSAEAVTGVVLPVDAGQHLLEGCK